MWTCRLLLTQVGHSANASSDGKTVSQEIFMLKCRGAKVVHYCVAHLHEGCLVHVVSQLVQRPKYIAIHGGYDNITDLLVSDSFGAITKVWDL